MRYFMRSSGCLDKDNCNTSKGLEVFLAFIVSAYSLIFFVFFFWVLYHLCCWMFRRSSSSIPRLANTNNDNISTYCELREKLPIIVFKESFYVKDTQCSVCLGEYQAEDTLKQIPLCRHTFHMHCIDPWLATHTSCPLCRISLLTFSASNRTPDNQAGESSQSRDTNNQGPQRGDTQQGHIQRDTM